jgi:hypothetical protein
MNLSKVFCGLTGCLFTTLLSGCVIVAESEPADFGTIEVYVTIDGADDFLVCDDFAIDEIEVSIVGHDEIDTVITDCNDLGVTLVDVPPGSYDVEVRLLAGGDVVRDPGLAPVRVVSGGVVTVDVDFPAETIS